MILKKVPLEEGYRCLWCGLFCGKWTNDPTEQPAMWQYKDRVFCCEECGELYLEHVEKQRQP